MKFGLDFSHTHKKSSNWDFRENLLSERSAVIKTANYNMSALLAIFRSR